MLLSAWVIVLTAACETDTKTHITMYYIKTVTFLIMTFPAPLCACQTVTTYDLTHLRSPPAVDLMDRSDRRRTGPQAVDWSCPVAGPLGPSPPRLRGPSSCGPCVDSVPQSSASTSSVVPSPSDSPGQTSDQCCHLAASQRSTDSSSLASTGSGEPLPSGSRCPGPCGLRHRGLQREHRVIQ